MGKSKIEWTDKTWNLIRARNLETNGIGHFCEHVSEGCRNCYAEAMQKRFRNFIRYAKQDRDKVEIFLDEETLLQPLTWRRPRMIFVCSMTDLFGEWVADDWLDKIFAVMALCPQHRFQILTKRPERMFEYIAQRGSGFRVWVKLVEIDESRLGCEAPPWPLPNVGLGVSVEDQKTADARIPLLLATRAAWRFVSYEPALEPIDFSPYLFIYTHEEEALLTSEGPEDEVLELPYHDPSTTPPEEIAWPRIDQVICGGESERRGQVARITNPAAVRSARDQCLAAMVAFFFKQWGEWAPADQIGATRFEKAGKERLRLYNAEGRLFPGKTFQGRLGEDGVFYVKVGKANAGRVLDGAIWDLQPRQLTSPPGELL